MKCLRCQIEFAQKQGQTYCTEYCRKKAEKARHRARTAPARAAKYAAWLAENEPKWEAIRAAKAAARKPRPPPKPKRVPRPSVEQRLLANSIPEPNSGCRLWLGKVHKTSGYAQIWHQGRHRNASRVAHEVWIGPIPEGKMVCHHCDMPACIEPTHIYAGTALDNHNDMVRRGRQKLNISGLKAYTDAKRKPKLSAWGRKRYAGMGI